MNNKIILFLFLVTILFILSIIYTLLKNSKENFKNKVSEIKDFDKNVIELDKVKEDKSNLKDFKPKKTSKLDLFCKQNINEEPTCYRQ